MKLAAGLGLDDVEDLLTKSFDHLLGVDGPDTANHPRVQVLFDPAYGSGGRCPHELGFELLPMAEITEPLAGCRDPLPGDDNGCIADNRHQIPMRLSFDPKDAEPIIGIVKRDTLDQASQDFSCCGERRFCHAINVLASDRRSNFPNSVSQ